MITVVPKPRNPGMRQYPIRNVIADLDFCCNERIIPIGTYANRHVNLIEQHIPPKKNAKNVGRIDTRFLLPRNSFYLLKKEKRKSSTTKFRRKEEKKKNDRQNVNNY